MELFVYFYIQSLFLDNRGSQVTEGKVIKQFISHFDIRIHLWKYIHPILMGLGAFWEEKPEPNHPDRSLSPCGYHHQTFTCCKWHVNLACLKKMQPSLFEEDGYGGLPEC